MSPGYVFATEWDIVKRRVKTLGLITAIGTAVIPERSWNDLKVVASRRKKGRHSGQVVSFPALYFPALSFFFFCCIFPTGGYPSIVPAAGTAGWATLVFLFLQWADPACSTRSDEYMAHGAWHPSSCAFFSLRFLSLRFHSLGFLSLHFPSPRFPSPIFLPCAFLPRAFLPRAFLPALSFPALCFLTISFPTLSLHALPFPALSFPACFYPACSFTACASPPEPDSFRFNKFFPGALFFSWTFFLHTSTTFTCWASERSSPFGTHSIFNYLIKGGV